MNFTKSRARVLFLTVTSGCALSVFVHLTSDSYYSSYSLSRSLTRDLGIIAQIKCDPTIGCPPRNPELINEPSPTNPPRRDDDSKKMLLAEESGNAQPRMCKSGESENNGCEGEPMENGDLRSDDELNLKILTT